MPKKDAVGWMVLLSLTLLLVSALLLLRTPENEPLLLAVSYLPDESGQNGTRLSEEQLRSIPGIGEVLAERILEYRRNFGEFTSPDEVILVHGIGPAKQKAVVGYAEEYERGLLP